MRAKVKVNPNTRVLYIPKDLLNDGFKGEMDTISNALTFTIIHPTANLEGVKESLEIVLRNIDLRLKRETKLRGE